MNPRSPSIGRHLTVFYILVSLSLALGLSALFLLQWRHATGRYERELTSGYSLTQALIRERVAGARLIAEQAAQAPQPESLVPSQATLLVLTADGSLAAAGTGRSLPRLLTAGSPLPPAPFSGIEVDDQGTLVAVYGVSTGQRLILAAIPFTAHDLEFVKEATGLDISLFAGQARIATTLSGSGGLPATTVPLATDLSALPASAGRAQWLTDPALSARPYLEMQAPLYGIDGTVVGAYTVNLLQVGIWTWLAREGWPWPAVLLGAMAVVLLLTLWLQRRLQRPLAMLRRDLLTLASRPGAAPLAAGYGLAEADALAQPAAQLNAARAALTHNNERLNERLVQIQTLAILGQVAAGVAHDLNNPMTTIIGLADIILSADSDPDTQRDVSVIRRQAERSGSIVRSLLSFARRQREEPQWVQLNELISQTLELVAYQARVNGIRCEAELAEDLPPVWADASQMQQVFFNLILNALQAMASAHGKGTLRLETSWLPTGHEGSRGRVAIRVRDDGPGIPEQVLPRLFQPYFTTKAASGGTGLGLYIAYDMVNRHGGRLWAENNRHGGACFTVQLPVAPAPAAGAAGPQALAEGPRRILLVESDSKRLALLSRILRRQGCILSTADDGELARSKLAVEPLDVVICALDRPDCGGRELYEWTRQHHPELAGRFVFVISDEITRDVQEFLHHSQAWVLLPPFQEASIHAIISQALR